MIGNFVNLPGRNREIDEIRNFLLVSGGQFLRGWKWRPLVKS
jgi:hypothetical protein